MHKKRKMSVSEVNPTWRDEAGACSFFDCGKATVEKIARACDAKRKVGRRALYNVQKMSDWLDHQEGAV